MKFFAITTALVACALLSSSVAADGAESTSWGYKHNDSTMASPEQWSEHYPTCGGSRQSPIDIEVSPGCNAETRSLTFTGDCTEYNLTQNEEAFKAAVNGGACNDKTVTIMFAVLTFVAEAGSCAVSANNASYNMAQFHLHAPSEHTLNGEHFDGEVHFVHSNTDGSSLLVVGVFFKAVDGGETDPWVASVLDALDMVNMNSSVGISTTSYADIVNDAADAHGVFNYPGSLTTPPCSEIVDWWVVKEPVKLSTADLERLQSQLKELPITDDGKNARPVHPLNGRVVTAYI
ncbi:Carbonic anhydrase [Phytophthora palmivora]|uniref:Carbonic anhydrase n=1 Tax=Phytophthora palmivora TaxID=4796 RepID=A0A2P4XUW0_9STRA|nr:Carbonic anhydrase [Phytophthora palmivora]